MNPTCENLTTLFVAEVKSLSVPLVPRQWMLPWWAYHYTTTFTKPPQIQSNVGFCQQVLFYLVPPLANINANYQRGDFLVCSLMFLPHFSSVIISNMDTGIRYFICQIQPLFIHFCFQTSFSQNLIFYIVKYFSSIENLEMA